MANRYFDKSVLTLDKRQVDLNGIISLSSAAAVSSHNFNSLVASVAKTGTGLYTITLADTYVELKAVQLTFEGTADVLPMVQSTDVSSAKTIVIKTWDISSAAAADVASACKIHVSIALKDSTAS